MDLGKDGLKVTFDKSGTPQIHNMLPYNPRAILSQASEMCLRGNHKEGIRLLQEVSEVEECRKVACVNLANAYLDVLEMDKALEYGQKCLGFAYNDPFTHVTMYKIYSKLGNIKTAEKHLIRARAMDPNNKDLEELEIDVLAQKNQLSDYNKKLGEP